MQGAEAIVNANKRAAARELAENRDTTRSTLRWARRKGGADEVIALLRDAGVLALVFDRFADGPDGPGTGY